MSITFVSRHIVKPGDTVDSLLRDYRLSCRSALSDIKANSDCRDILMSADDLPPGLPINIPPNAALLVKERTYILHRLLPKVRGEFARLREASETCLKPVILGHDGADSAGRIEALNELAAATLEAIDRVAEDAWPLVGVCVGMSQTHVGEEYDRLAAGTTNDALCGLYWALTPMKLGVWREAWNADTHTAKWRGHDPDSAWSASARYLTTVESLVVQQLDTRIREAQSLERRLLGEASGR